MRIGRWSEPRFVFVCQLVEVIREADANETSGEDFFYMGIYIHEIDTSLLKLTLLMRRKINIHYKE